MRMIGIGLMGFLLAGIALLLSTMNILEKGQRFVREITVGPQLVFEHRTATAAPDPDTAVIYRSNPDHPVLLSGLPAYQSVAFTMPVDARPTSGYLQIDATSQVLDGVEGVLRISIHNVRRGELLLRPGEVGRSLRIPLSPTDFAGDQLVVSFSLQGTGPQHQCGPEDGVQAVVEIETTSAVFVTLDRPLESARDKVHAWGQTARVAWPLWLRPEEQVRRLVLATQFKRRNIAPVFVDAPAGNALTTVALRAALASIPVAMADAPAHGWPRALATSGANAGLRRFHRKAVWRERYDLRQSPDHRLPKQLDLHMMFGRLMGGQHWALTVTLNNRLVYQGHITGAQAEYQALIDLPADMQAASNVIEVVAITTAARDGPCDDGPELVAEMLPASHMIAGEAEHSDPLSELHTALSSVGPVNVAIASSLTAIEAKAASRLLDRVIPAGAALKPAGTKAHIVVLAPGSLNPALPEDGQAWLVRKAGAGQALSITALEQGAEVPRSGVSLLVVPGALEMAEVAS